MSVVATLDRARRGVVWYLKEFTGDTPWAHLDIAGPSFNEGSAHGYTPVGGTGVGVRTMLSYLESRAPKK